MAPDLPWPPLPPPGPLHRVLDVVSGSCSTPVSSRGRAHRGGSRSRRAGCASASPPLSGGGGGGTGESRCSTRRWSPVRSLDAEERVQGCSILHATVDLEHNQYRSFQGLTCLMQISTRTEDFIIDTLKLRIIIGPYLTEHFKDPAKRKIMHGADRDIMWLQRDFRLYVCNLFDTGQASRVLEMERNSLEYLLRHFCGVTANKAYQNADWRLRPLSAEMIKYAREDTHFLFYIYDLMRLRLQQESTSERDLLLEVQERSNEICSQLYEKEQLTDKSYLHIYGLQDHELNAKQLAVVSALYEWRDFVAREQDESTGYVLPNKALIEIAKNMPTTAEDLRRIVKSKYPVVDANFNLILEIVWDATENSNAFEAIAEQLKKVQLGQETFGALVADPIPVMQTPVMQTPIMQTGYFGGYSNEQAQSDVESSAYYYTQFPEYSSSGGWSPQELQGIPTSGYHDGCYYGHQPSINQSSTGTGQPAARNNAGGFQDWRKQQSSPHPWQPK